MDKKPRSKQIIPQYRKTAYLLILLLTIIVIICLLYILPSSPPRGDFALPGLTPEEKADSITADIYQDGILLRSIDLSKTEEPYTFMVTNDNGSQNEIEVRPGSIGIRSANCPDKLCVQQGFINTPVLPITCLPNRLVIQIRKTDTAGNQNTTDNSNEQLDGVTY